MRFDGGRQSILGDADEVRKSGERRKIVRRRKNEVKTLEIVSALQQTPESGD